EERRSLEHNHDRDAVGFGGGSPRELAGELVAPLLELMPQRLQQPLEEQAREGTPDELHRAPNHRRAEVLDRRRFMNDPQRGSRRPGEDRRQAALEARPERREDGTDRRASPQTGGE